MQTRVCHRAERVCLVFCLTAVLQEVRQPLVLQGSS